MSVHSTKRPVGRKRSSFCFLAEYRAEDKIWRHRNGRIAAVYNSGKKGISQFESHYPNGELHTMGAMKDDHPVGEWHTCGLGKHYIYTYDDAGHLIHSCCYPMAEGKTAIIPSKRKQIPHSQGKQRVRV